MKDALLAQIFIQIRPMDAISFPDQLPMVSFFHRCVEKARIPDQGSRDGTPVGQLNGQRRRADLDVLDTNRRFNPK